RRIRFGWRLSDSAHVRPELQYLRVRIGDVHEPKIRELDRAIPLGRRRGVRGHPGEEGAPVLDGNRFVRGRDHVEPRGDAPVGAALGLACIMRWYDEQVTRPLAPYPFQAVPRSEEHMSELQSLRHLVCR